LKSVPPGDHSQWKVIAMTMVRVVIVDDQLPFRRAAQAVVESTDSFEVVGAFETAEQGMAAVDDLRPDLILMDVNLPGIDGVEASRRLRLQHPDVVVILLSSYDEAEFADLTQDCGAAAYVPKSAFGPDRLEATWAAIAGSRSC
jgi:DNA-binding NarL/FixJ family response regulator